MNKKLRLFAALVTGMLTVAAHAEPFSQRQDVQQFITELAKEQQFDRDYLQQIMASVQPQEKIIEAITRPAEAMTWARYRAIFMTNARIQAGRKFMAEHAKVLDELEQRTGVPKTIMTAILGVETFYGQRTGSYRVLDALATLGFDYPKRSEFFRSELKHFLRLARQQKLDPREPKGSYAGAMGLPQFMPSSYLAYAADYEGDGHKDIWHNPADAAASIANYLKVHHWQAGQDIAFLVKPKGDAYQKQLSKTVKPNLSLSQVRGLQIAIPEGLPADTQASLLSLDGAGGEEVWLTLENFYVITRYNHSPLYAMAVFQLSRALAGS
ncbi:MAG: lytic murein transglycosylase B [Methylococcales bacterium]|nr:lytic murein transglycosylase B [Methylococcales bacterium]